MQAKGSAPSCIKIKGAAILLRGRLASSTARLIKQVAPRSYDNEYAREDGRLRFPPVPSRELRIRSRRAVRGDLPWPLLLPGYWARRKAAAIWQLNRSACENLDPIPQKISL